MREYLALSLAVLLLLCSCGNAARPQPEADSAPEQPSDTVQAADGSPAPSAPDEAEEAAVCPLSRGEYAAIRAGVPYGGLAYTGGGLCEDLPVFLDAADAVGANIQRYAAMLGLGARQVDSREAVSERQVIGTAVHATPPYAAAPESAARAGPPELQPIAARVREEFGSDRFWLQEHVEQSIKALYGEDFTVAHGDGIYDIHYDETMGVYFQPPRGGGFDPSPVVLGYEDLGDRYRVEIVYLQRNMNAFLDPGLGEEIAPYDEEGVTAILAEYVQNRSVRFDLYLQKQGDALRFEKQTFDVEAYRTTIPYEPATPPPAVEYPVLADEAAVRLADFIHGCWRMGLPPQHSFDTPAQAPRDFVLRAAMNHTGQFPQKYGNLLKPPSDGFCYIQEHLERSAKRVFGEAYVMEHGTWGMGFAHYDPDQGVYAMDAVGMMGSYEPVVTSYRREGDKYIVSASVVLYGISPAEENEYGPVDHDGAPIPREGFVEYCLAQDQHIITLQENADGSLLYLAHRRPGD